MNMIRSATTVNNSVANRIAIRPYLTKMSLGMATSNNHYNNNTLNYQHLYEALNYN